MCTTIVVSATNPVRLAALRSFLEALENPDSPPHYHRCHACVGECEPDAECGCCAGGCACPVLTVEWWSARLSEVDAHEYRVPRMGRGVLSRPLSTGDTSVRAALMAERLSRGVDLFGRPLSEAACQRLCETISNGRNGAVVKAVNTREAVA